VGGLVIRVGILGLSPGNGHPFSFSSIINGYSDEGLRESGWPVIYDYVRRRDASEFGFGDVRVTHAWTQDEGVTRKLCQACLIPNPVSRIDEMVDHVDAVILARDDYERHWEIAEPFLKAGCRVFVDKPLALDMASLRAFLPYLESGQVMSCSGLRYARELDIPRSSLDEYGDIRLIRAAVVQSWEKYGIHMVDAIMNLIPALPESIIALPGRHTSVAMGLSNGTLVQIDALAECPKTFLIDIWGTKRRSSHELEDNFSNFRRLLWHFFRSIRVGKPAIPVDSTLNSMRILMAGRVAAAEKREVWLDEFKI